MKHHEGVQISTSNQVVIGRALRQSRKLVQKYIGSQQWFSLSSWFLFLSFGRISKHWWDLWRRHFTKIGNVFTNWWSAATCRRIDTFLWTYTIGGLDYNGLKCLASLCADCIEKCKKYRNGEDHPGECKFHAFKTNNYKLHFMEHPTGIRVS